MKVSHLCFINKALTETQRYNKLTIVLFCFALGPQGSQSVVQPAACKYCGLSHGVVGTCSARGT